MLCRAIRPSRERPGARWRMSPTCQAAPGSLDFATSIKAEELSIPVRSKPLESRCRPIGSPVPHPMARTAPPGGINSVKRSTHFCSISRLGPSDASQASARRSLDVDQAPPGRNRSETVSLLRCPEETARSPRPGLQPGPGGPPRRPRRRWLLPTSSRTRRVPRCQR